MVFQFLDRKNYENMTEEHNNAMSRFFSRNHTPPRQAFDLPLLYGGLRDTIALFEVQALRTEDSRLQEDLDDLELEYKIAEDIMPEGNEDNSYTTLLVGREPASVECVPEECLEDPVELGIELGYPKDAIKAYEDDEAVTRHERDKWAERTDIPREEFDLLKLVPYRPAPEHDSVKSALREGKKNYQALQVIADDYSFPQLQEKLDESSPDNYSSLNPDRTIN